MTDKIAEAFGVAPLDAEVVQPLAVINSSVEVDYEYARGNMLNVIEKGREALDGILDLAQRSQQPRSYEVVSDLIRTLSQTNKDLLELAKQKKDLEAAEGPKTVNNNLFVGSTAELLKLMKKQDG